MAKLSVKALGLSTGLVWAFCNLLAGWTAMFGWGGKYVDLMSSIYIGYSASILGGIIGGVWAFLDGLIGGLLIAIVYNKLAKPKE
jgi:hypothetical protein